MGVLLQPLALLAIILAGYGLKRFKVVGPRDYRVMQKVVFNFTLPCAVIYSFALHKPDSSLILISLFGFCCTFAPLPILYWASRNEKIRDRFFIMINGSGFNVGNFGFPVVQAFLGPGALMPAVMFDIGNSFMLSATTNAITSSMLGIPLDKELDSVVTTDADGNETINVEHPADKDAKRLARRAKARSILHSFLSSVPFDVYVVMLLLLVLGIQIPTPVGTFVQPAAVANSFCSMLMVGMLMDLPASKHDVIQVSHIVGWRLALSVVFALVAWFVLPFDGLIRKVLLMVCFTPTAVFATLFTDRVLGNARLAGFCLAITAVISMILMTILTVVVPG